MKYILAIIVVLVIGVTFMALTKGSSPEYGGGGGGPAFSPTKIPYNNGFYAGPYNPKLPVIDPKAK